MTTEFFLKSLESYYGATYPVLVRAALEARYSAQPWGPVGRRELYEAAIKAITRAYKMAPDIAQLIPLENEALDKRELIELERTGQKNQKLIAGRTAEEDWQEVEKLLEGLGLSLRQFGK